MLQDETYREWTKVFNQGSYYQGDWSEGSKMLFLGPDPETGEEGGMVAVIDDNRQYEIISIKHIGMINNGVDDTTREDATKWTPAYENYTFKEKDGKTEVLVKIDIEEEYQEIFEEMWPQALQRLKELSEKD